MRNFIFGLIVGIAASAGAATVQLTHTDAAGRTQVAVAAVQSLSYAADGTVYLAYRSDDGFCSAFGH